MKDTLLEYLTKKKFIIILYTLLAIGAGIQSLSLGKKSYTENGKEYNRYNNYTIFKKSFDHLKTNQDLYILYPEEHWDLYKYTPTFSVLFGFFSYLPDFIGLTLWDLLNSLILIVAIYNIPNLSVKDKGLILIIISIELMTSLQNAQSNGLITGLLILSFGLLENKKYFIASLCIVLSIYIKLFGIVGFVLFLFYPKKWKLIIYSFLWSIILFVIPLIFVSFNQCLILLQSYLNLLMNDHTLSYGYSVMGWLNSWFSLKIDKNIIVLIGVIIFLIPLIKFRKYNFYIFRYLTLASILIWVVIFNHKAESPTFIIAMAGIALWYIKSRKNMLNIILFVTAILLTSLSPTDIFPKSLRNEIVVPYTLKVVPCILIWLKILYDMIVLKESKVETVNINPN